MSECRRKIVGSYVNWRRISDNSSISRKSVRNLSEKHSCQKSVGIVPGLCVQQKANRQGDMLDAIVTNMDYDIVLEGHSGYPQRVNILHPSNMSLQFPLLTGRLFQQYVVTAFYAIEQNRIDYVREHQNDIRNEYLSGIYDAINRGDSDGSDCGLRLILPQSFTGGPRYMYSHYLDALAICRVHGNPSFFITFTCNVKWPEIAEYVAQFPLLNRTDVLAPVRPLLLTDRRERDRLDSVILDAYKKKTTLTEWLDYSERNADGRHLTYLDFPSEFVWYTNGKYWQRRRVRTKAACEALGLLENDREWEITLEEAALTATPAELRTLLAHILAFCQVSHPVRLWNRTWKSMSEDIPYTSSISLNIPNLHIDDSDLVDYVLYELEGCLNNCSKSLADFGLRMPPKHLMSVLRNILLMKEKSYDGTLLAAHRDRLVPQEDIPLEDNYIQLTLLHQDIDKERVSVFAQWSLDTGNGNCWTSRMETSVHPMIMIQRTVHG
ncbi:DNA helicase [Tanacetum coccineum]|uniref:DNA helicase n=1 Tax=Tanacetum coccineum TaxID=301880 RepID=A0ABQ5B5X5_9ASTR